MNMSQDWGNMFPHVIAPRPNEWLPGVLLRCDMVNDWPSGATARLIADPTQPAKVGLVTQFIVNTVLRLDLLAEGLGVPKETLLGTTFRQEVMQFAATKRPHVAQFGETVLFGVCPRCLAEDHLLLRNLALPFLETCVVHNLLIQRICSCGAALHAFQEATPFTCGVCGSPWSQLPQMLATDEMQARDQLLVELYAFIWRVGCPTFTLMVWCLIEDALEQRGHVQMKLLDGKVHGVSSLVPTRVSAALLVLILASFDLPAAWIESATQPPIATELRCWNESCPLHGVTQHGNVHLYANRPGSPLWFCTQCGSRFTTHYLVATSDLTVIQSRPSREYPFAEVIEAEQKRIAIWRHQLEMACENIVAEHETPLTINWAFHLADVPQFEWLMAPQLGLVALVESYQQRQVETQCVTFIQKVASEMEMRQRAKQSRFSKLIPDQDSFVRVTDLIGLRVGMFEGLEEDAEERE